MNVPSGTPLQRAQTRFRELMLTERENLGGDQYSAFVAIALEYLARESSRLERGALIRALGAESEQ